MQKPISTKIKKIYSLPQQPNSDLQHIGYDDSSEEKPINTREEFEKINLCKCHRICLGHEDTKKELWNFIDQVIKQARQEGYDSGYMIGSTLKMKKVVEGAIKNERERIKKEVEGMKIGKLKSPATVEQVSVVLACNQILDQVIKIIEEVQ